MKTKIILFASLFLLLGFSNASAFTIEPTSDDSCFNIFVTDESGFTYTGTQSWNMWLYDLNPDSDTYLMSDYWTWDGAGGYAREGDPLCGTLDNLEYTELNSGVWSVIFEGPPYSGDCAGGAPTQDYELCKASPAFMGEYFFEVTEPPFLSEVGTGMAVDVSGVIFNSFGVILGITAGLFGLGFGIRHAKKWVTGRKA